MVVFSGGGVHAAGQLQGDGDLGQQPQRLQVVKPAEQSLGAEVGEFLPDFQLIAPGHQLVDAGDDAMLFRERGKRDSCFFYFSNI